MVVPFLLLMAWYRVKTRKYFAGREPMSDDDFMSAVPTNSGQQRRFCLSVRFVVGAEAGVPAEMVYPTDKINEYDEVGMLAPFMIDGLIAMKEIGLDVDVDKWAKELLDKIDPVASEMTMADFLQYFLTNWNRFVRGKDKGLESTLPSA